MVAKEKRPRRRPGPPRKLILTDYTTEELHRCAWSSTITKSRQPAFPGTDGIFVPAARTRLELQRVPLPGGSGRARLKPSSGLLIRCFAMRQSKSGIHVASRCGADRCHCAGCRGGRLESVLVRHSLLCGILNSSHRLAKRLFGSIPQSSLSGLDTAVR